MKLYVYEIIRVLNYTCMKLKTFEFRPEIITFDREKNSKNCDVFINIEIFKFN